MGAEFFGVTWTVPSRLVEKGPEALLVEARRRVEALDDARLRAFGQFAEERLDVHGDELEAMRNVLLRAIEQLDTQGEFDWRVVGGLGVVFTGGLSWGDDPTAAYESILILEEAGLFDDDGPSALDILREFVLNVEAAGLPQDPEQWPDLVATYQKAKEVLK